MKPYCPICKNSNLKRKAFCVPSVKLWQCRVCTAEFLFPQPNIKKEMTYGDEYFDYYGANKQREGSLRRVKEKTYALYLAKIEQYAPKGKILDIGCAAGHFLDTAKKRGWDPYGLDIASMGKKAQSLLGAHRVKLTTLKGGVFPASSFEVITFLDVLEHLPDPVETLNIAYQLLKPDGVVAVVTPNTDSISAKLMGKYWNHYHVDHLFSFNGVSIDTLFEKTGFHLIEIKPTVKYFNLAYIAGYFESYPTPLLTKLARLFYRVSPTTIREMPIPFFSGSLFAIGQNHPK